MKKENILYFLVCTTEDTTALIRVFLQLNCNFQGYSTQDTTALIRVFLQVICRFQVYTTKTTVG